MELNDIFKSSTCALTYIMFVINVCFIYGRVLGSQIGKDNSFFSGKHPPKYVHRSISKAKLQCIKSNPVANPVV